LGRFLPSVLLLLNSAESGGGARFSSFSYMQELRSNSKNVCDSVHRIGRRRGNLVEIWVKAPDTSIRGSPDPKLGQLGG
jgi:hypothetical protein